MPGLTCGNDFKCVADALLLIITFIPQLFFMRKFNFVICLHFLFFTATAQSFRIQISPGLQQTEMNGRLLLLIANNNAKEPRFQISDAANTQM